jgi:hypothetical protein
VGFMTQYLVASSLVTTSQYRSRNRRTELEFPRYSVAEFSNRNRGSMTVQMATVKMDGIVQCLPVRREELNAFRGHDPFGFGKCNLRLFTPGIKLFGVF